MATACAGRAAAQAPPEGDENDRALTAYFERLGLSRLLATNLEQRLEAQPRSKRQALAEQLGKVYVTLIREAPSDVDRAHWEEKAKQLLAAVPDAESIELRISVNQAIYDRAETLAERSRLRLATTEEFTEAQTSLRSLAASFGDIGQRAHRRVDQLEKIESAGDITDKAREELGEVRRLQSLSFYYAGWSNCYLAILGPAEPHATEALKCFGWLLGSAGRPASLDKLPASLLQYEHIGRAAIGCALAAAARGNDVEAIRWLDAIEESTETPAVVREQVPSRRMAVLGGAKRWADLDRLVTRLRRGANSKGPVKPLSAPLARLLAVMTLEADRRIAGEQIESLTRTALADLIAQKEVAQVLDLVEKYGTAPLGDAGFIAMYVRGMQDYDLARKAHATAGADTNEPTTNPQATTRYRSAARLLEAAEAQPDAAQFVTERSRAGVSRGLALFYVGDFSASAEVLSKAWTLSAKTADAEQTLWMCVLAWNRAAEGAAKDSEASVKRDQAVALFLKTYPESANAPRLVLMRTATGELKDDDALKALSSVPRGSPVYDAARRQIARILYSKFRSSLGTDRDQAAIRFVEVAKPIFLADAGIAADPEGKDRAAAADRAVTRARQILDVLLSGNATDTDEAAAILKRVRALAVIASIDLSPHEPELLARQVQIDLARGDQDGAIQAADKLYAMADRGGQFGGAVDRLIYKKLAQKWTSASDDADGGASGAMVIRFGVRILDRLAGDAEAMREPGVIALQSTCAAAATARYKRAGDVHMRDLAIKLDKAVLAADPGSEPSLRRLAENSDLAGDSGTALECWRVLLDAAQAGTPQWFEAKYQTLRLLSALDPTRAAGAMKQLAVLYPDYGPEPWSSRLRTLATTLGLDKPGAPGEWRAP